MSADHFTYRVTWSAEDQEHVGLCTEFPTLTWLAATPEEALSGIRTLVHEVIDDPPTQRAVQALAGLRTEPYHRLTVEGVARLRSWQVWEFLLNEEFHRGVTFVAHPE